MCTGLTAQAAELPSLSGRCWTPETQPPTQEEQDEADGGGQNIDDEPMHHGHEAQNCKFIDGWRCSWRSAAPEKVTVDEARPRLLRKQKAMPRCATAVAAAARKRA